MHPWLKNRLETAQAALPHPGFLAVFAILQVIWIILVFSPSPGNLNPFFHVFRLMPWYGWTLGWTAILWLSTLDYAAGRKRSFDETSRHFFGAYLDHLMREGHQLFGVAGNSDFYFRVNDWQRKAIEGIAIGLGHEEAEGFFQRMEGQHPLSRAHQESQDSGNGEPLCRALQGNLDELDRIRNIFVPRPLDGKTDLTTLKTAGPPREPDPRYLLK
jgi:hypothetical protein